MLLLGRILLLTLFSGYCQSDDDSPVITTTLGKIRGYWRQSAKGETFSAFEGIPYAKAPTGPRRFELAEPADPWEGTWNANLLVKCAQTNLMHPRDIQGEEDCLHLNVYVPRRNPSPKEKLDVIVHIHGGGFMSGSSHLYAHPEYLMDKEVIFISINYRLGILGFLSTGDDVVPGNNGLKDQVLALKWVQEHIGNFGGNRDSVTLTGLSSGASSVHFHYLSPMSKGLFHRGFSQSGCALNPSAIQDEPVAKAKLLGAVSGCPTNSTRLMVDCLKQRTFKHLLTKTEFFHGYKFLPVSPFGPVLEKGPEPFISTNPYYLMAKGQIQDLPWLVSNTAHEGLFPTASFYSELDNVSENWNAFAPLLLDYNHTLATVMWEVTARKIKEFYFGDDQEISQDNFFKLVQMVTDRLFLVDTEYAIKWQAKFNKSPVYYYRFEYLGDHNTNKTVAHGEDAKYYFYNVFNRKPSPNELKMTELLVEMLTSFAKTGEPKIEGVEWKPTKHTEVTYLNITSFEPEGIRLESAKNIAPIDFWKQLGFLENQNLVIMKDEL